MASFEPGRVLSSPRGIPDYIIDLQDGFPFQEGVGEIIIDRRFFRVDVRPFPIPCHLSGTVIGSCYVLDEDGGKGSDQSVLLLRVRKGDLERVSSGFFHQEGKFFSLQAHPLLGKKGLKGAINAQISRLNIILVLELFLGILRGNRHRDRRDRIEADDLPEGRIFIGDFNQGTQGAIKILPLLVMLKKLGGTRFHPGV
jgi:hypothetical protein